MRAGFFPALAGMLALTVLGSLAAAQNPAPAAPPPPEQAAPPPLPGQTAPLPPEQAAAPLTPAQLDQLTAPIALYPDPLVAQILMAATYPLEVVEADRWLQQPASAALKGDQLAAALAQQRWDPSVKSLVAFPQILLMMDSNLTWTEELGDAFLAGQTAILESVQRLRQKAAAAGRLKSTPQEVVSTEDGVIVIEPPGPDIVDVPVYDPNLVYGAWPYPDYPPDYFPGFFPGVTIGPLGFGWLDLAIIAPLWGWDHCDWRRHRIDIDPGRFHAANPYQPAMASGVWQHDPAHRGGVPYRDPALRARFHEAATAEAIQRARGFPAAAPGPQAERGPAAAALRVPTVLRSSPTVLRSSPTVLRSAPPVMRSFGRGPEVRAEAQRGQASRLSVPAPARVFVPRAAAPAARAAPAAQGGGEHK